MGHGADGAAIVDKSQIGASLKQEGYEIETLHRMQL